MSQTSILCLVSSVLASTAAVLGYASATVAQTIPTAVPLMFEQASLTQLAADLAYPNSSQRFFEAGREQFEQDIQQLLDEDETSETLLEVKPEVLEQFED
ncbi:MAG: hypothetical protein ACFB2W_10105 [Leptolyngbyaceae cyanobacterium]